MRHPFMKEGFHYARPGTNMCDFEDVYVCVGCYMVASREEKREGHRVYKANTASPVRYMCGGCHGIKEMNDEANFPLPNMTFGHVAKKSWGFDHTSLYEKRGLESVNRRKRFLVKGSEDPTGGVPLDTEHWLGFPEDNRQMPPASWAIAKDLDLGLESALRYAAMAAFTHYKQIRVDLVNGVDTDAKWWNP